MKIINVYDTSALLEMEDNLELNDNSYVSPIVIKELENIKNSSKKDNDVKEKARKVVRLLQCNKECLSLRVNERAIKKLHKRYQKFLVDNNDTAILLEGFYLSQKNSVCFFTGDLTLYLFARTLFENGTFKTFLIGEISDKRFWDGFKIITPTQEQWERLNDPTNKKNIFDLKINEYAVLFQENKVAAICRWDGETYVHLGYRDIHSSFFGRIAPRNLEQKCYFDLLQNPNIPIVNCIGRIGSGKALVNDLMIPTTEGNKFLKDIQVGDYVFDRQGQPTEVLGIYPQGMCDVYEVTLADGRKTYCNDEHLWTYCSRYPDKWKTVSLRQIIDKPLSNGYFIPMNKPVEFSHKNFSIHPYVIGAFLGDGCCLEKPLTFSSENEEIPKKIASLIPQVDDTPKKNSSKNHNWVFPLKEPRQNEIGGIIKNEQTSTFFRNFPMVCRGSHDKEIPEEYLYGDVQQRLELLQGLMDTDGTIGASPKGRIRFTSTSQKLIRQVQWLINSLGWQSSLHLDVRPEKYTGDGCCYNLNITVPREEKNKLFSLERKKQRAFNLQPTSWSRKCVRIKIKEIKKKPYQREMTCLLVNNPEHLFLANDFIVTHNTFLAIANALYMIEQGQYDKLYYIRNNFSVEGTKEIGALPGSVEEKMRPFLGPLVDIVGSEEYVDDLIESGKVEQLHLGFLRGRSLKNCIVVVDESQNLSPSHIKMLISRMAENSKLIFTGDYSQIDSKIFRGSQNGIMKLDNRLQNNKLYGQIRLNKVERSEICQLADKLE